MSPADDDMARPCTVHECKLSDAMLQPSPHGEIAIPIGGIGLNRYRDSAHFEVGSQLIGQP